MTGHPTRRARALALLGLAVMAAGAASACSPTGLAIGAGATVATAASEERGLGGTISDAAIQAEINGLWLGHDLEMYRAVDMTVREGRVLLTGEAPTPKARVDAVRLAWQADGVKTVINEIQVDDTATLFDQAADLALAKKLETRLLFDRKVRSINYTVDVVNGTVYLMGVAQSVETLNRALAYARDTRGVRTVVNHVRIKGEAAVPPAPQNASPGATGTTKTTTTPGSAPPPPAL